MKSKAFLTVLVGVFVVSIFVATPFKAAGASVTLKAVSFIPTRSKTVTFMGVYAKKVTERSNGELTINWIGGPEVVATGALAEVLSKGRIDVGILPPTYASGLVPELPASSLGELLPNEERETGCFEWITKYFKKANIQYLGRATAMSQMFLFSNFPVTKYQDLIGHQIGVVSVGAEFIKKIGATPVMVPKPEWYTTVEKGVVDAYIVPAPNVLTYGLHEVTKYIIDHRLKGSHACAIVINLDKWNSLSKKHQDLMNEVMLEVEAEVPEFFNAIAINARNKFKEVGIEFIKFSPADAEAFVMGVYEAEWEKYKKDVSPEVYAEARKLFFTIK